MAEELGSLSPLKGMRKPGSNSLGFSLEFQKNAALVTLSGRELPGGLLIKRLELDVPEVSFPFDVTGGAEQFCHHRCRLRTLVLVLPQDTLAEILRERLAQASNDWEGLQITLEKGIGWLSASVRLGDALVPFTARFTIEEGPDLAVRAIVFDLRAFGALPFPVSHLLLPIARSLIPLGIELTDGFIFSCHPVRALLRQLLPRHGWKIPDLSGLQINRLEIEGGRLRLCCARFRDELPEPYPKNPIFSAAAADYERRALIFRDGCLAFRDAEKALQEGHVDHAHQLYLGQGALIEPVHPVKIQRLLEIGLSQPERAEEVEDLVREALASSPDAVFALLTRAVLLERRTDPAAGRAFEQVGRACEKIGECADAVLAYLKAGALLVAKDPNAAIANLEKTLTLAPDSQEAMRSLIELYTQQKLTYRALRMNLRLAGRVKDTPELARCHVRVGAIYLEQCSDLKRAQRHLETALLHDPGSLRGWQLLAEVFCRLDEPLRAARALVHTAEAAEAASDQPLALEIHLRLAQLWDEQLADPANALLHYEQVLKAQPNHPQALFKVGVLAETLQQTDRAIEAFSELLEHQALRSQLPLDLLKSANRRLASIYLNRPEGYGEARLCLTRYLELEPNDIEAWQDLERIERAEQSWPEVVRVLVCEAPLLSDTTAASAVLLEAAQIAEQQLHDQGQAEQVLRRALVLTPNSNAALTHLARILRVQRRFDGLAEVCAQCATTEADPQHQATWLFERGRLLYEQLSNTQTGAAEIEAALRLDPTNRAYAQHLLRIYRDEGRVEELVQLIATLDFSSWEVDERVSLWMERAQLLSEQPAQSAEAIHSYQAALALAPSLLPAHRALADLHWHNHEWAEAKEALEQVLTLGYNELSAPDLAIAHRQQAQVALELGDTTGAIDHLQTVLLTLPEDDETLSLLPKLLQQELRFEELAGFYTRRAEREQGEAAAALHMAAAELFGERLGQLAPAAMHYQQAVAAAPDSQEAPARLAALQRVYARLARWEDVAQVIRQHIELTPVAERIPMHMSLAAILSSRLNDTEGAALQWEEALAIDPCYRPALLLLTRYRFNHVQYHDALALGSRIQTPNLPGPPLRREHQASLALDMARAAWALQQHEVATQQYLAYLELESPQRIADIEPEVFERLELTLSEHQRYQDLEFLYRHWLDSMILPERHPEIRRILAKLLFEFLGKPDQAIAVLEEQLQMQPDDQRAVDDLLHVLRSTQRWSQLAQVLEDQWQQASYDSEKLTRLAELADLCQNTLDQPEQALLHYRELYERGHLPAARHLLRLYRQLGMQRELADLLEQCAAAHSDSVTAVPLLHELGLVASDQLEDRSLALQAFKKEYTFAPTSELRDQILALLRENGDPVPREKFLAECISQTEDPQQRRELLLEHAEICLTQLDRIGEGVASLAVALSIAPNEALATRLFALYEQQEDWQEAAQVQELLLQLTPDPDMQAQHWHQLGRLAHQRLAQPDRAAQAFSQAVNLAPEQDEYWQDWLALLEEQQSWQELANALVRRAQAAGATPQAKDYLSQAIDVAAKRLTDVTARNQILEQIVDLYQSLGDDEGTVTALSTLLEQCDAGATAALSLRLGQLLQRADRLDEALVAFERARSADPSLRSAYQQLYQLQVIRDDRPALAQLTFEWAESPAALDEAAALYHRAANGYAAIENFPLAIEAIRKAIASEPDQIELYQSLASWLSREGRFEELLDALHKQRELVEDREQQIAINFEMGTVFREHLHDQDRAAVHFEQCLSLEPNHPDALQALADLRYAQHDWKETAALYERLGDRVPSARQFVVEFRLGELAEQAQQFDDAIAHYQAAIASDPTFVPARQRLIGVLHSHGRHEDEIENLKELIAILPQDGFEDLAPALHRQLGHAQRRLLRFDEAAQTFLIAHQAAPDDVETIRLLKDFYSSQSRWPEAIEFMQKELDHEPAADGAAERWCLLGDWCQLHTKDIEQAKRAYREALRLNPPLIEAHWKLWNLICQTTTGAELVQESERLLKLPLELSHQLTIHQKIGQALIEAGEPLKALPHFEQIISLDPNQAEHYERAARVAELAHCTARQAELLETFLELRKKTSITNESHCEHLLKLAQLYHEQLRDPLRAVPFLKQAHQLRPHQDDLLLQLGTLCAKSFETLPEAIEIFRKLLSAKPLVSAHYRMLARLEAARGEADRAAGYFAGLQILSPDDPEAIRAIKHFGLPARPQRPLAASEWDQVILNPDADCLLQRILMVLAPYLEQLFTANFERFGFTGVSERPRVPPAVADMAQQAQLLISSRPLATLVAPEPTYQVFIESGEQPTILLSSRVVELSRDAELLFLISREVAKVAMGCVLLFKFSRMDLLQLFALLVRLACPEIEAPLLLPPSAPEYLEAIRRIIPPEAFEIAIPLIRRYAYEPQAHDFERWLNGVRRTADRVGLLACGDLNAALTVLARFSTVAIGQEFKDISNRIALLERDADMLSLFSFAFSERYLMLRAAMITSEKS